MKRRRRTPERIVRKLREAERLLGEARTIPEAAKAIGTSEQTFHRWRNQYGGMKADDAKSDRMTVRAVAANSLAPPDGSASGRPWSSVAKAAGFVRIRQPDGGRPGLHVVAVWLTSDGSSGKRSSLRAAARGRTGRTASAPGEIRTPDLRFRRPTLYPAELRAPHGDSRRASVRAPA